MKDDIRKQLSNPRTLEKMYHSNKTQFKKEFNALYPELEDNPLADFWNERLNYESTTNSGSSRLELTFVVVGSILAGILAKLPELLTIDKDFFYTRNIGFLVFPFLTAYFVWKNKLSTKKISFIVVATLLGLFFINFFPDVPHSDTLTLSSLHLLLFLWCILGFAFVGGARSTLGKCLAFLRYNGDLVVISALLIIAGGILTGVTFGLFSVIGVRIEEFYGEYVVVFALAALPILGTYLTQTNSALVSRISPVIAKIFSPLVLVMLLIYLFTIVYLGKDPYNNREFLMVFNALLIGVMAIIFFSVAEKFVGAKKQWEIWVIFLLSVVTIVVNGIALSAILFRISEWGITPNRVAVLGGNVLILIHLFLVAVQLFKGLFKKTNHNGIGKIIVFYLPIYFIWTIIVTFVFPFLFGFE